MWGQARILIPRPGQVFQTPSTRCITFGSPASRRWTSSTQAGPEGKPLTTLPSLEDPAARIFSGIQPTGSLHLGNYLGSIRNWLNLQQAATAAQLDSVQAQRKLIFSIVDFHALTQPQDPTQLRSDIRQMAATILASGLDPERCILFRQSHVAEHTQLAWPLQCLTPMGWLNRMTQWKSKLQTKRGLTDRQLQNFDIAQSGLCQGLFAYPVLQAADILLYRANLVPVGEDQLQHIELARDIAALANKTVQQMFFPLPRAVLTPTKRLMSLRDPARKMSKSDPQPLSRISLTDTPEEIHAKIRRAVTDSISQPTFDPELRPGVSNLLEIYSGMTDLSVAEITQLHAQSNTQQFKEALAEVVVAKINPIRTELVRLQTDPEYLDSVLAQGADRAREIASVNYRQFGELMGL
ncbi:Tryptophan--tRNA ligase, mitochondrial [Dimargaris cristalligena]|uniref:Tryptophan--tRNA ligase, mitochondrial n=1 Tax=Dimargaris cristalligena TaxID=215637 RepID=A0A4P9ZMC9_9FUNG|nr:Tryptophan--tRNA ligase, mitochondrial [Dimargaris cristalligena]RKP33711.1 hypothetical protein BJ085DRAFT_41348 [Dimargaris cristalligena]|eukprot:RKP33711.1 hypothetical protein BJ085DRAFT_41348 [Dimargaris cristalligena]